MSSSEDDEGCNDEEEVGSESEDSSSSESEDDEGFDEEEFDGQVERIVTNDPTLTRVAFNDMGIGDEGAGRLVVALAGNTVITHLWLQNNAISAALMIALLNVLVNSTTLEVLDLSENNFGVAGARAVARFLHNNSSLRRLSLQYCDIGVEGVRVLVGGLPSNSTLTHLNLSCNNFGDEGAIVLAGLFPGNSTLTALALEGNAIFDAGARKLAEALPNNFSLISFIFVENDISDAGARLFATALLVNCTVTILNLFGNDISEALEELVEELAHINADAVTPQDALERKVKLLRRLDEGRLRLLGFEESEVEEEILRLGVVCRVGWLVSSGVDGEKEEAVTLVLDQLEHFPQAKQRRGLFQRFLASPSHGEEVAESVNETTARSLYWYAVDCGATPGVLMNILRGHPSLCTCKDVRHRLHPFMLLATIPEAGAGNVMELLLLNPNVVEGGIPGNH